MEILEREQLAMLVEPDRVHRSVYSDPRIFELEMSRVFGRAWLVIGHESQIPLPGDYFLTDMARQPVIVVRHTDHSIRVLINRCSHRGTQVAHIPKGQVANFTCAYHGWTFETDGRVKWVPIRSGYGENAEATLEQLALAPVPRVDSYRGFLFASLATTGPSLIDFLGPLSASFDDMVDRAPDGELEVAGGVFKHAYNGNWKLMLENHLDGVHPNYVHVSSVRVAREAPDPGVPEKYADIAIRQMRQNGAPDPVWENTGIWSGAFGHGYMGDYHDDSRLVMALNNPAFNEYYQRMEARHGKARAREILGVTRWNTIVYPNTSFMGQFRQLRIVHPIAVDRTVVYTYSFRLKGAPAQMFRDTIAFSNVVNGTASWVLTDDLEVYERIQRGLSAPGVEWVNLSRGLGRDVDDEPGMRKGGTGTSEIFIRNQLAAWVEYMTAQP